MHILEQYALSCGLKIGEPHIERLFFPLGVDNFITIHNSSKFESRNYDYFSEVVSLISKDLNENKIFIAQVGIPDDPLIPFCLDLRGKTNLKQLAYVLSKSMLHIGIDSFPLHLASYFNVPVVGLYSNMYKNHSAPYWRDDSKSVLLESDRNGLKPSYSNDESPKTINMIKPNRIAGAALDLLGFSHDLDSMDCFYIGEKFHKIEIEVIPNFLPNNHFASSKICLRMDLHWSMENSLAWIRACDANLVSDREIDLSYLSPLRERIKEITFILSENGLNVKRDYLKALEFMGINFSLKTSEEDLLSSYRLHYFDWKVGRADRFSKKCIDKYEKICDTTFFKTSKVIFSNGNKYPSMYHANKDIAFDQGGMKIEEDDLFWEWIPYFKIYNRK